MAHGSDYKKPTGYSGLKGRPGMKADVDKMLGKKAPPKQKSSQQRYADMPHAEKKEYHLSEAARLEKLSSEATERNAKVTYAKAAKLRRLMAAEM